MNREEYEQMYRLEDSHWWFVARRNLLMHAWHRFPPPQAPGRRPRILDVGCGTGGTLDRLKSVGDPVGLDSEALALEFCRKRGYTELVQASATEMPFAPASFDAAVALDVLEHIPDHEGAAREICRVLAPGGLMYASVPAYGFLWSGHDDALMHKRRYIAREVRDLVQNAGLNVVHLTYTVTLLLPPVALIRLLQRVGPRRPPRADVQPTGPGLNRLLQTLLDWEGRMSLRRPLPLGVSVFVVARKPPA